MNERVDIKNYLRSAVKDSDKSVEDLAIELNVDTGRLKVHIKSDHLLVLDKIAGWIYESGLEGYYRQDEEFISFFMRIMESKRVTLTEMAKILNMSIVTLRKALKKAHEKKAVTQIYGFLLGSER